jgi:phosphoenolpyruvate carboxylase
VALRFYLTEVHELGAELSLSHAGGVDAEISALGALARPQSAPRRRALPPRADRHLRAAGRHLHALTGTEALRHAVAPQDPYATPTSCSPTCA